MRVLAFILVMIVGLCLFLTVAGMAPPQAPASPPAAIRIVEARIAIPTDSWRYEGYGNFDAYRFGEFGTTTVATDIKSGQITAFER
jgi:hypothetical protein